MMGHQLEGIKTLKKDGKTKLEKLQQALGPNA
jgi:hypothetical protein